MTAKADRSLTITEHLIGQYSRRGNYHSEPATSDALGLPGLVAQGMHAAGPAYGELLDAWGETFLERGEIDLRFVGVVLAGDAVHAALGIDDDRATLEVTNTTRGHVAVAGTATRSTPRTRR